MAAASLSVDEILQYVVELAVDKKQGNRVMIGRRLIGQTIFSAANSPVQLLGDLLDGADDFLKIRNLLTWSVDKGVGLQQLLMQVFCLWITPFNIYSDYKRKPKKNNSVAPVDSTDSTEPPAVQVRKPPPPPPPSLSPEDKLAVVRAALKVTNMRMESKTWTLIIRALQLRDASICEQFVAIVHEALENGTAPFELISICIHDKPFRTHFSPPVLFQALLLGQLRGSTVEAFASERSAEFRNECRKVLLDAETIVDKRPLWVEKVRVVLHREPDTVPSFYDYVNHVYTVLQELRAEPPADDRVHKGWAYAAMKRGGKRFYLEHSWTYEMFHELIWSVLAQRPEMKSSVLRMISRDFKDTSEAQRWTAFNAHSVSAKEIPLLPSTTQPSLLQENVDCLTLPIHLASTVMFVGHVRALQILDAALEALKKTDKAIVGLDAEWSAYTGYSKASILQLATKTRVFIIDLQPTNARDQEAIFLFLDRFFNDPALIKIGFGFHEDLTQLRNAVPRCRALYAPKKLICINELVKNLRVLAGHPAEGERIQVMSMDDSAEANISVEDGDADDSGVTGEDGESPQKATKPKEIRGLSALCVEFLGRPLDKMEQCSVWDRRPLRPSQIRYAALDAYCLLQIFDHCVAWANELNVDAYKIALKHQYTPVSLPLFCGDEIPSNGEN